MRFEKKLGQFWPSHVPVCSTGADVASGAHVSTCCLMYANSTRLILPARLRPLYFESEIRYSKHSPLQSSFLLCFVTTIVSISRFQSLISVSALSSCLYMSPNRVEALMAGLKQLGALGRNLKRKKYSYWFGCTWNLTWDLWNCFHDQEKNAFDGYSKRGKLQLGALKGIVGAIGREIPKQLWSTHHTRSSRRLWWETLQKDCRVMLVIDDFAELIESSIDRKRIDETDYRVLFKAAQTPNIRWYIWVFSACLRS